MKSRQAFLRFFCPALAVGMSALGETAIAPWTLVAALAFVVNESQLPS